ncbi:MAG TPA: alpha/beta fold hydrolase [Gemmataceae bacterium]
MTHTLTLLIALAAADPAPTTAARGEAVVTALSQKTFDAAAADFTPEMQKALPPDKLKTVWPSVLGQFGPSQKELGTRTQTRDKDEIVFVSCQFEKGPLDVRLVYSADKKLGGMQFVPPKPAVEYKSPAYVHADRFKARDVTVGAGTPWELPGTLSMPVGDGPFPAVVLVHGSGPHDRDETIGPNKPLRDLADGLASRGIAVLRYEKRTRQHGGKLMGTPITIKEEVLDDALAAVTLLRQTPGVDPKRVYVVGHSLGAMLAPKLATLDPKLAGIAVLAGNARPLEDLIVEQFTYLGKLGGEPDAVVMERIDKIKAQAAKVKDPKLSAETPVEELPLNVPAAYWLSLRGYEPATVAANLTVPVLVLSGERDYQVPAADYEVWSKALAGKPTATLKRYPGLNHLFMAGDGPATPADYQKEGHVAEQVVEDVAGWIRK